MLDQRRRPTLNQPWVSVPIFLREISQICGTGIYDQFMGGA